MKEYKCICCKKKYNKEAGKGCICLDCYFYELRVRKETIKEIYNLWNAIRTNNLSSGDVVNKFHDKLLKLKRR